MPNKVWGLKSKNAQQDESIGYLLDPSIDLVILQGIAGSGKTLLALAAGLEQVFETHMYNDIIFTRAPIAVGEELGFLPGTEGDKMAPWTGGLIDNLEFLTSKCKVAQSVLESRIKIKAMCYMRGRSFRSSYVIIDEVQNMSAQQLKVLLTRAGEDCKVVCLGDVKQIDNKKLSIGSNGLTELMIRGENVEVL